MKLLFLVFTMACLTVNPLASRPVHGSSGSMQHDAVVEDDEGSSGLTDDCRAAARSRLRPVYLVSDSRIADPVFTAADVHGDSIVLLQVPPKMYKVLQDSLPGFALVLPHEFCEDIQSYTTYRYDEHQAMSAVLADFNGDGIRDAVVIGRDDRRAYRVGLLSRQGSYDAFFGSGLSLSGLRCQGEFLEYMSAEEIRDYLEKEGKRPPAAEVDGFIMRGEVERPYWTAYVFQDGRFAIIGYTD